MRRGKEASLVDDGKSSLVVLLENACSRGQVLINPTVHLLMSSFNRKLHRKYVGSYVQVTS